MSDLLFGRDATPGIVSVAAGRDGVARVWRRLDGRVVEEQDRFPLWFLLDDLELLAEAPFHLLSAADLRAGVPDPPGGLAVVALEGDHPYRHLALTTRLDEVEAAMVAYHNKRSGEAPIRSLRDLGAHVYWRPAAEQYLTLCGRTYFKGLAYTDLVRLQFDLETTGLDDRSDRIFMINVSDSTGFAACLDIGRMDEREILLEFARIVRERDPDVIENHNVFEFDIPFLIKRASALGVKLALGRDGGGFSSSPDSLKVGDRSEPFTRYSLVGREIIDTLHTVKRYGAIVREMRDRGLKQAARYFGVAREGREYVHGPEIWRTFQEDPERVRRYGADDVDEVNELSKLLMGASFALASIVPKPYERVATSGTGQGLIEPLLVRAYVSAGHSIPRGQSSGGTYAGGRTELFTSGVVRRVVKIDVASLYPSLMLAHGIQPKGDRLGVFTTLLRALTERRLHHKAQARRAAPGSAERVYHEALQQAMKQLINSFYGSLGTSFALFGDLEAAAEVTRLGRDVLASILAELERRGVTLIEADTDGVFFSVPQHWTEADEQRLVAEVDASLPDGITVELEGRYPAMYSYMEKNYVLQTDDGALKIVGGAFRSSKSERYGERFLREAMPLVFAGDVPALRALYQDTIARLRARQVPIDDVCVQVLLSKTPEAYRKAKRKEEQYEVLLAAGQHTWRPGQRVRYYQTTAGKRLQDEHEGDYDPEYYVQKLRDVYAARLARAFTPADFQAIFETAPTLFEPDLSAIRPIATSERVAAGR